MPRKLLQLALLLSAAVAALAQAKPAYEIYAIRYGTIPGFPVSELVTGAEPARKLDIAMMIWLVRGNGHNVLVDSGFYHDRFFKDWHLKDFTKPSETLAKVGLKPDDITDIVITHMHWDHADGMDLFPNARIWIQKDELQYYAGEAWQSKDTHGGIDEQNVLTLVRLNTEGRVGMVDGDAQQIIPGITCYTGGKHTYQSQYVGVQTAAGTVVLASDNMYLYENLERHVPIAATGGIESARPGSNEKNRRSPRSDRSRSRSGSVHKVSESCQWSRQNPVTGWNRLLEARIYIEPWT